MAPKQPASKLPEFDGKDVSSTTIAITNAGDGLSKALAIEPRVLHHGQKVYVVLECEVTKIGLTPIKDAPNNLVRVHTLKAGTSTIIEAELVASVLEAQIKKLEEASGITRLPYDEVDGSDEDIIGSP
jgi:hypothetical protein